MRYRYGGEKEEGAEVGVFILGLDVGGELVGGEEGQW